MKAQRDIELVLGKTGSGKTTLARELVKNQTRVIVLDSAGFNEYGIAEVSTFDHLRAALMENYQDGAGFFRVSYAPRSDAESAAIFELASAVNYSKTKGVYVNQSWLVLEEADLLPPPDDLPEYNEAISRGRHFGMNILAVSLYPYKLPPLLRRQATKVYAFSSHEPSDIRWYRDVFGDRADEIIDLPLHHYLEWSREGTKGPLTLKLEQPRIALGADHPSR